MNCLIWLRVGKDWLVTTYQHDPKMLVIIILSSILGMIIFRWALRQRADRIFLEHFGFVPNCHEKKVHQARVFQVLGSAEERVSQLSDEREAILEQLAKKNREIRFGKSHARKLMRMAKARGFAIEPQ